MHLANARLRVQTTPFSHRELLRYLTTTIPVRIHNKTIQYTPSSPLPNRMDRVLTIFPFVGILTPPPTPHPHASVYPPFGPGGERGWVVPMRTRGHCRTLGL